MTQFFRSAVSVLVVLVLGTGLALGQAYPNRPVRILVGFQAGQGTDVATRHIASSLSKAFGQQFIVENRPGAAGNIGTSLAAQAQPDGYTLLMGTAGTHAMNPHLYDGLGFDVRRDFEAIGLVALIPMVIAVHPSLKVDTLPELLRLARERPEKINAALPSTTARLVYELLRQNGVPLFGVIYKGSGVAMPEALSGQVPVLIDTVAAARPQLKTLKALAVTSPRQSSILPGVPSVAEQGLPGFDITAWNVLFAPRGTPSEVQERIGAELSRILADPAVVKALTQLGFEPAPPMKPAEVTRWVAKESDKFGALIQRAHMKAN